MYVQKACHDREFLSSKPGRRPILSDAGLAKVKQSFKCGVYQKTGADLKHIILAEIQNEAREQGLLLESVILPSRSTFDRLEEDLGVVTKSAEFTTEARAKATSSLRNGVSFAVMSKWSQDILGVSEFKLFNGDGHTAGAAGEREESVLCCFLGPPV